MSESPQHPEPTGATPRCPHCDSVVSTDDEVCLMCGASLSPAEDEVGDEPLEAADALEDGEAAAPGSSLAPTLFGREIKEEGDEAHLNRTVSIHSLEASAPGGAAAGEGLESVLHERQSPIVLWMVGIVFVITAFVGALVVRYGGPVQLAIVPSPSPLAGAPTLTPSATRPATETSAPTGTATITPEPSATVTPQPPQPHEVQKGETLFGLSLIYNVSMEAIASLNGFSVETPIQSGQQLQIPWPTATPPLEPIALEVNGEPVIADPSNCERYEIQEGDALSVIAARNNINFELLLQVNRLSDRSILQPGDTICIPEVIYGNVLPPTPGPSPTPSPTSFPSGPTLLYPSDGASIEPREEPITLQWLAVKDLQPDEWYMVEVTDLSVESSRPQRAFTRENAYRLPHNWRPVVEEYHEFRWRVSIVRVSGQRQDGGFIYTFGGRFSEERHFSWLGAVPTPTPTPTLTPSPTPP